VISHSCSFRGGQRTVHMLQRISVNFLPMFRWTALRRSRLWNTRGHEPSSRFYRRAEQPLTLRVFFLSGSATLF
jgi:hypothetical protein